MVSDRRRDAVASNNVWAVGRSFQEAQTRTIHGNGSTWNFVPSPDKRNSNNRLHGITVTPNGTLWAVGTTGVFAKPEKTLILRKAP